MTPTGSRFQIRLDDEFSRMQNEWFFKWHHIGGNRTIEIDGFDGRSICYSGLQFDGSARDVYWDTIQRYIRKKISTLFDELEIEIKDYEPSVRRNALTEVSSLITGFSNRIRKIAIDKDRILRGNGHSFPQSTTEMWRYDYVSQIDQRTEALNSIYVEAFEDQPEEGRWQEKLNAHYKSNPFFYWMLGSLLAVVLTLLAL